jgi:hypothetical protein
MKYNAFISYSHHQDSHLAPSLEKGLEQFAKPTFKRRALNIFRDSNDLSASPDLWGKIEEGLENSDYFIFLASPAAAQSRWCKKEVDYWRTNKSMENFLVVLTDGDLIWEESVSDFDWSKTTAIPNNLSGAFKNEPLFVDFRESTHPSELALDNPDFKTKVVLLAATLHGKHVGDMVGEDLKQHKRTIRIRNSAIFTLSVMLLAAIGLAIFAFLQKNEAEHQRKQALANSYLSYSEANFYIDPTLAVRLAEYAYEFAKSNSLELENYEDQIVKAFYKAGNFYLEDNDFQIEIDSARELRSFNDYKLEMTEDSDVLSIVYANGTRIPLPDKGWWLGDKYSFSPKGKFVITNGIWPGASYAGTQEVLSIYNLKMEEKAEVESYVAWGTRGRHRNIVKFDSTESRFIITGEMPGTSIYDLRSEQITNLMLHGDSRDITDIGIMKNGNQVALAQRKGVIDIYSFYEYGLDISDKWQLQGHNFESIEAIKYSHDQKYLFSESAGFKRKWNSDNDFVRKIVQLFESPLFDAPQNLPTIGDNGTLSFENEVYEIQEKVEEIDGWRLDYISKSGDTIAQFHTYGDEEANEDEMDKLSKWVSPDKRYYATRNGLFNQRNELLIDYNETRHQYNTDIVTIGFSDNSKYFFIVDKIYFLGAEQILSRLNDAKIFGSIARLSKTNKIRYNIEEGELTNK